MVRHPDRLGNTNARRRVATTKRQRANKWCQHRFLAQGDIVAASPRLVWNMGEALPSALLPLLSTSTGFKLIASRRCLPRRWRWRRWQQNSPAQCHHSGSTGRPLTQLSRMLFQNYNSHLYNSGLDENLVSVSQWPINGPKKLRIGLEISSSKILDLVSVSKT